MSVGEWIATMLLSGAGNLAAYLAAHVLLCLLPAFFVAGGLSALVPRETVTRYLGRDAPKWVSYPAAALGGFVLAVCSCTIMPLFAGIHKKGAGLGPAITFLFVGPAVNILAIAYTGAAIGMDIAIARIVLSAVFGIVIGLIMAAVFKDSQVAADNNLFDQKAQVKPAVWAFFGLLLAVLIVGTLQVDVLTRTWFSVTLPVDVPVSLQNALEGMNLSFQGALLILMLVVIALAAWRGLEPVLERTNGWTWATTVLVAATLLIAAPALDTTGSIVVGFTGRFIGEAILLAGIAVVAARGLERHELQGWLWETWKFVKQIFPLLVVGVFGAGMVKVLIPEQWIQTLAGSNTIWANLMGVLFGVFMYFPTLVEVPIARMFLDLGMHRGPLLAYLMADPELSLQSILVTGKILGNKKTWTYVSLVTVFSTLAGYIFGLALTMVG